MNDPDKYDDEVWDKYWYPKIEAECREYELKKKSDRELIKDFIANHIIALFLLSLVSVIVFASYMAVKDFQRDIKSHKNTVNVPYTLLDKLD